MTVLRSGRREHFDVAQARAVRANKRGLLITRVADLIKMAFTASTAQVMEIRLEGLVVLKDVIDVRPGAAVPPGKLFLESTLLLTFSPSSPELWRFARYRL